MKFNNFLKLCLLICLIGPTIAASSRSSADIRKSGKGKHQSQSIDEEEENVDKDQQLSMLKKLYIRYLLNPDDKLLVDASLISSLYHIKGIANLLLHNYNGLKDESKEFRWHFAEYHDLFDYILRGEHNNEECYCVLFKMVYWTLRKNQMLSKSSAWRAHMHEVLQDTQLMSEEVCNPGRGRFFAGRFIALDFDEA